MINNSTRLRFQFHTYTTVIVSGTLYEEGTTTKKTKTKIINSTLCKSNSHIHIWIYINTKTTDFFSGTITDYYSNLIYLVNIQAFFFSLKITTKIFLTPPPPPPPLPSDYIVIDWVCLQLHSPNFPRSERRLTKSRKVPVFEIVERRLRLNRHRQLHIGSVSTLTLVRTQISAARVDPGRDAVARRGVGGGEGRGRSSVQLTPSSYVAQSKWWRRWGWGRRRSMPGWSSGRTSRTARRCGSGRCRWRLRSWCTDLGENRDGVEWEGAAKRRKSQTCEEQT